MSILQEATNALHAIETERREPTAGELDSVRLAEWIRVVRRLLSTQEARWVGTTEAKHLPC
jgi:hypothetical protein